VKKDFIELAILLLLLCGLIYNGGTHVGAQQGTTDDKHPSAGAAK